jgi:hypothetical protein
MNYLQVLLLTLRKWDHLAAKGHEPQWFDLGAGKSQCLNCLKGGKRAPRFVMAPLRG